MLWIFVSILFFIYSNFQVSFFSLFPSLFSPSLYLDPVFRSTKGILRLIRYADIRAILKFQKPRASFASFANKFVYRGIAAGLVPPVSLRQSQSRTLCPSRRPRCLLSQLAVDRGWENTEAIWRIEGKGRNTEGVRKGEQKLRNGVENVKNICSSTLEKKKKRAVDSHRRPDDAIKARKAPLLSFLPFPHQPPFQQASYPRQRPSFS